MFYSQVILAKKGQLGKIWLAAHFEKKLTKQQIFSTDITASVETMLSPTNPLALRVSDCTEAMWKMKLAYRAASNIDLDPEKPHHIDDLRHYGNIDDTDTQFESIYFSAQILPLESGRGKIIDRTSKRSLSELFEFPSLKDQDDQSVTKKGGPSIGAKPTKDREESLSISEIEIARAAQPFSIERSPILSLSKRHSSILSAPPSAAIAYGFDDDLPAFQESFDQSLMDNNIALAEMFVPEYEPKPAVSPTVPPKEPSAITFEAELPPIVEAEAEPEKEMKAVEEKEQPKEISIEEPAAPKEPVTKITRAPIAEAPEKKAMAKPKRGRMVIDERIELSDRTVRQRIEDSSNIIRRRVDEDFFPEVAKAIVSQPAETSMQEKLSTVYPINDLCPELMRVLEFSTNTLPLPFALKPEIASQRRAEEQVAREKEVEIAEEKKTRTREKARDRESVEMARGVGEVTQEARSRLSYDVGRLSTGLLPEPQPEGDLIFKDSSFLDVSPQFGEQISISGFNYEQEQADRLSALAGQALPSPISRTSYQPTAASNNLRRIIAEASPSIKAASPLVPTIEKPPIQEQQKSERTQRIVKLLEQEFSASRGEPLSFNKLCASAERKTAACFFLEVLQLKTWGVIDVKQPAAFNDIQLLAANI